MDAYAAGYRWVTDTANKPMGYTGPYDITYHKGYEDAWRAGRMHALQDNKINMGGRKSRKRRTRKSKRRKSYKRRR
jgi:hypothetical protein